MNRPIKTPWRGFITGLAVLALCACGGGSDDPPRGDMISGKQTAAFGKAQTDGAVAALPGLQSLIGGASVCDTSLHKLTYRTIDPHGDPATASAGVLIPSGCPGPYPVVVYHHGTQLLKSFKMSDPANLETFLANSYFASQGYIVVMPDYLGYGESSLGYHPYLDAESMGQASVDALRAARRYLGDTTPTSGKLFITGYSQGGHSAMATQRAMERDYPAEFSITAAAPMAGFYSLSATFADAVDTPTDLATILFAYGLTALQKDYGDVYAHAADAFQTPWDASVESLLPGVLDVGDLLAQGKLPTQLTGAGGLLTNAMAAAIRDQPTSPIRRRLAQNDMTAWTPRAPMTLCHGSRDTIVPFKNTTLAAQSFADRGVAVTVVDLDAIPAFRPAIDAQIAAAGTLLVYHAQIAPPLCFSVVKKQVFDPRR